MEDTLLRRYRLYNNWQLLGECEKVNTITPEFLDPLDYRDLEQLTNPPNDPATGMDFMLTEEQFLSMDGFHTEIKAPFHRGPGLERCMVWNFYARVATIREMKIGL